MTARLSQEASALVADLTRDRNRAVSALFDIWIVTDTENGHIYARPLHVEDAAPQRVSTLSGVRLLLGDEILVANVAKRWVSLGSIRSVLAGFSLLQATPIIVDPAYRTGTSGWTATTDFSSLRKTVYDLDPGMSYLVEATASAYLASASASTKVGMGVRIGFASDTSSTGNPEWGPGHQNTTPTWSSATYRRVVSSVTSVQVTGRAFATASGSHSIGDGQVDISITPLFTAGRV